MKTIHVPTGTPYDVRIGAGLLSGLGPAVREVCPKALKALLVTDDTVERHWAEPVAESLKAAGLTAAVYVLPGGETSKTADRLLAIINFAAEQGLTRSDVLVALGGGMVGDITGLAAALYMRGVSYIQVPTTLLAAVDSSVGGKTAVDLPAGKNLLGAFWQPGLVLCDTNTLNTLPSRIFTDGCAEVIKCAVLFDEALFDELGRDGLNFDRETVIARCVRFKRNVVAEDERDTGGRRTLLNLGHTLGHAVEACSDFSLSHGQSVAIGMAVVSRASAKAGICSYETAGRICDLLTQYGLPVTVHFPMDRLMEKMLSDKKRSGDRSSVIVPERIGACGVRSMARDELYDFMKAGL